MYFADYVKCLKTFLVESMSNDDIVNLIFHSVSDSAGIKNSDGEQYHIDKSSVSRILTGKLYIPEEILEAACRKKVREEMPEYFRREIVPLIPGNRQMDLRGALEEKLSETDTVNSSKPDRVFLKQLNEEPDLATFLSLVLQNVLSIESLRKHKKEETKKAKSRHLNPEPVPLHPTEDEARYVIALFEVYSEKTGRKIESETDLAVSEKMDRHFQRQRRYFYDSECVRLTCRDIYSAEEANPFDDLAEDVFDAVIDTYEKDFPSGMDRLTDVLDKASNLNQSRSILLKETQWVGPAEKKGICHYLVNESKLDGWVGNKYE